MEAFYLPATLCSLFALLVIVDPLFQRFRGELISENAKRAILTLSSVSGACWVIGASGQIPLGALIAGGGLVLAWLLFSEADL